MPLVPAADIDSILFITTVVGTANITYAAVGANVPGHRVPPAGLDSAATGLPVGYKLTHVQAGKDEFENGLADFDSATRTLVRTNAGVTASTSGAGIRHSFSAGPKHVAITILGARLAQMATVSQDGLASAAQAQQLADLAAAMAYEPVNF